MICEKCKKETYNACMKDGKWVCHRCGIPKIKVSPLIIFKGDFPGKNIKAGKRPI